MDITYRLSVDQKAADTPDEAEPLLREFRPLLQPERLLIAADILHRRAYIPDVAGIYAWWFNVSIGAVPLEGTLHHKSHHFSMSASRRVSRVLPDTSRAVHCASASPATIWEAG